MDISVDCIFPGKFCEYRTVTELIHQNLEQHVNVQPIQPSQGMHKSVHSKTIQNLHGKVAVEIRHLRLKKWRKNLKNNNQSINQSIDQSISQSVNQSIKRKINQSINQSISRSINQSINQLIEQSLKADDKLSARSEKTSNSVTTRTENSQETHQR